ncbi:MAG: hypothetical protein AB7O97_22690 [Planctomycetota bacterium]
MHSPLPRATQTPSRRDKAPLAAAFALCGAVGTGADLRAQSLMPEAHWGGGILPSDRPELRLAWHLNRFTEFSKTGQRFNEITETTGFNLLSLSWTENTPRDPDLFVTVTGGVGHSGDQPTRFLQNDYVHEILGQAAVPVAAVREETEYAASATLTKWLDGPRLFGDGTIEDPVGWRTRMFFGLGAGTSTLYHEAVVHAGGSLLVPETFVFDRHLRLTVANRSSWNEPGNAWADVADFSNVTEVRLGLVPPRVDSGNPVLQFLGNPEFGLSASYDTGFFQRAGEPVDIWFAGLYVQWATGLRFETWNDFANSTDFGPTYGLRVSFDVYTLFSNSHWRW